MVDFTQSEDRRMLGDTLGRYLADQYDIATRNKVAYGDEGHSAQHWRALADLGITAVLFDEAAGGFGGGGFDIATVFEALGRALVVEPFLGTLMAGRALAVASPDDEALPAIVAGEAMAAFAHVEPDTRHDLDAVATRAERDGATWRLTGTKAVVAQAEAVDVFVLTARVGEQVGLFVVDKGADGLSVNGYGNIDGGRSGDVTLAATPARLVAEDGRAGIDAATAVGLLALSAEALGLMETMKESTLDYLRTRQQFGIPIGKFQALQHRLARVLLEVGQARSAVVNAADALGRPGADRILSAAKYTVGHIGKLVVEESIQMHGGIGMTWELPLSHYAKRLTMIDHQLGDEDDHLQRYIALGHQAAPAAPAATAEPVEA